MPTETHHHLFTLAIHLDACHSFVNSYACECGATAISTYERDLAEDPYAGVYLDPDCSRCRELRKGAEPLATLKVYAADGTVEIERP